MATRCPLASPPLSRLPTYHLSYPILPVRPLRRFPGSLSLPPFSPFLSPFLFPFPFLPSSSFPSLSLFPSPFPPFLLPVPGARFSPRYNIDGLAPGLAPEAADYLQAPPSVCRDNAACRMTLLLSLFGGLPTSLCSLHLSLFLSPSPLPLLSPPPPSSCAPSPVSFSVSAPVPVSAPSQCVCECV